LSFKIFKKSVVLNKQPTLNKRKKAVPVGNSYACALLRMPCL